MTLRHRITLIAASAVALAVLLASLGVYAATARTLRGNVDRSLRELAAEPGRLHGEMMGPRPGRFGGAGGTSQIVDASGVIRRSAGAVSEQLPVTTTTIRVASGESPAVFETVDVDGAPIRILTLPAGTGLAVQVARPLGEVETALAGLRGQLVLAGLAGIGLAALLGMVVARRAVRPVDELTRLAEEVAATQDLSRRIGGGQADEIGRLGAAFDRMLAQLEQARSAQQQLVADASHELRTPLTSLRTNIEVLAQLERLSAEDRRQLVDDVVVQIDEFSQAIGGLVELARGERPVHRPVPVRLDEVVAGVAGRFSRGGRAIDVDIEPTTVTGDAERLERLVANLVENAAKYAPDGPIEVRLRDGVLQVRDHGPGFADEDLPRVFERFYRAAGARSAPGSGLGLSIVRQIAESHGGGVGAGNAPDGGAVLTVTLPLGPASTRTPKTASLET
ncbi:MAG TPA: HAMP domain-containing sensor histidine kinase [Egicoccus sp.]|nr:HAMP domain-containing sensor histidine kinase [Egicoccus sp.]HSK23258.1 HAMP domain-containing sensor histidine kinase [Egicoccus sp.]